MIWRCDLVPQYEAFRPAIENAIRRVLGSGRYILASEVAAFEKEFAAYLGVLGTVGVANGTDALELSLRALGVGPGHEVITTPFTAIPTVSAIIESGATPVFVDIEEDTFLLDTDKVTRALSPRTKAVVPVHLFGNVVDITRLRTVVGAEIAILEDACQAHGSRIGGRQAGSLGDAAAFSFYPTKNLGAYGDGGAVATNRSELAEKVRLLRMYGMIDYNHIVVNGTNSRLDELQAAILREKLKKLDAMNSKRRQIARRYAAELPKETFAPQAVRDGVECNFHVYCALFKGNRERLVRFLEEREIQTNVYYIMPAYMQKANEYLGVPEGSCPVAEQVCKRIIALPMYPELPGPTLDRVLQALASFEG